MSVCVCVCVQHEQVAAERGCEFLSPQEELVLCQYYHTKLIEFCKLFQPPVPPSAIVCVCVCVCVCVLCEDWFVSCRRQHLPISKGST